MSVHVTSNSYRKPSAVVQTGASLVGLLISMHLFALGACSREEPEPPPPYIGELSPGMVELAQESCCYEPPDQFLYSGGDCEVPLIRAHEDEDFNRMPAYERATAKAQPRLEKRPLGHLHCRSVDIVYDRENNELYSIRVRHLYETDDLLRWLDALEEAGLEADLVDQIRDRRDQRSRGRVVTEDISFTFSGDGRGHPILSLFVMR